MAGIEHGFQRRFAGRGFTHADAGGNQQRSRRTLEHLAHCADHRGILFAVGRKATEIVVEGGVDHRIGRLGTGAQAGEVAQFAALHVGTRCTQCLRTRLRSGQADDLVAGSLQLLKYATADEAGGTGQKYTHEVCLHWNVSPVSRSPPPGKVVTLYRYRH